MGVNFYDCGIGEFVPGRSISHYSGKDDFSCG